MADFEGDKLGPCPNCEGTFQSLKVGGVVVDVCDSCGGLWMDEHELEKVLAADHRALQVKRAETPPAANKSHKLGRCPRCGGTFIQLTNLRANVKTDSCPVCYGVFLERGELDAFDHPNLAGQVGQLLRKLVGRH
jgi:Zn-finger nucleic acid-binding protein